MASQEKFDLIVRARDRASARINGITKSVVGMIGAFAAVRTVTGFLQESVTAAVEAEKIWNDLGASVERHGGNWDTLREAMEAATSALQQQTGLSDEALARSAQVFIDYGSNAKQAMDLVKVAADLAAGANMSLASATDLVSKASVGYTSTLSRYGIILDETLPKSEKFAAAIDLINQRFGGAAAARMQTTAGQLQKLNELYGDMQEQIGGLVLGPMTDLIAQTNTLLTVMNNLEDGWDRFLLVVRLFGTANVNVSEQMVGLNQIMAEATVAVEKLKIEQMSIFERYPDFTNNMSDHADKVKKVAKAYRTAKTEFVGFNEVMEYDTFKGKGGIASKYMNELDLIPPKLNEVSADMMRFAEDSRDILASNMGDGIADMFLEFKGFREGLQDIFKGIAEDFTRMVINQIMNALATKLVTSVLNIALPGSGLLGLFKPAMAAGPTGEVVSTGGMSASAPNVTINVGNIIGEEQYIRQVFVPILERDARLNMNRLALRG